MILLRHGQSLFNLHFTATRRDPGIHDAPLTPLGAAQAEAAAVTLDGEAISRIIVSPYTRALQTAVPIAARRGLKVIVNPLVRERFAFACDIGTPASELARAWPEHDFSALEEVWWPAVEESHDSITGRAARFCAEMAALADWPDTLIVAHWGFILALTGESVPNGAWRRVDPNAPAPERIIWHP